MPDFSSGNLAGRIEASAAAGSDRSSADGWVGDRAPQWEASRWRRRTLALERANSGRLHAVADSLINPSNENAFEAMMGTTAEPEPAFEAVREMMGGISDGAPAAAPATCAPRLELASLGLRKPGGMQVAQLQISGLSTISSSQASEGQRSSVQSGQRGTSVSSGQRSSISSQSTKTAKSEQSVRTRLRAKFARPTTTISAFMSFSSFPRSSPSRKPGLADNGSESSWSPSGVQRADRIHAHRETIGQLKRETTAQQLVSPKLKEGVERDELKARIMPDLVTQTVADETIKGVFFRDGKMKMNELIAHAHEVAVIDEEGEQYMPVGRHLHAVRMGIFNRRIGGLAVENLVLTLLEALVPVGSLVLLAVAVFGTAMSSLQVMCLFALHSACIGVGGILWMFFVRHVPVPLVLFTAGLLNLTMLPLLYAPSQLVEPAAAGWAKYKATWVLAALHGIASGGVLPCFHSLNYTNCWSGNTLVAGFRMGLVEPLRLMFTLLFIGATVRFSSLGYIPVAAHVLFWSVEILTLLLSLCCLLLPISRDLRLPVVPCNPSALKLYPSYCLLVLSEWVGRLGGFLDVLFIAWWVMAGYERAHIALFFYVLAPISGAVAAGFCSIVCTAHSHSRPWLAAMAFFILPPSLLGSLALYSSQRLGPQWTGFFLGASMVLSVPKRLAPALLRSLSLTSRWKYLTYQTHASLLLQLTEAISPFFLLALARTFDLNIDVTENYSDVFARSSLLLSLPFAVVQILVQLATLPQLQREGIVRWTIPARPMPKLDDALAARLAPPPEETPQEKQPAKAEPAKSKPAKSKPATAERVCEGSSLPWVQLTKAARKKATKLGYDEEQWNSEHAAATVESAISATSSSSAPAEGYEPVSILKRELVTKTRI